MPDPQSPIARTPDRPPPPPDQPAIGLALGGGIARGWAHIGVMRALDRIGLTPAVVAGTSIGALVGGVYLAGHLDALEAWARSLNRLRLLGYLDLRLNSGGLVCGHRLIQEMRKHLGETRIDDLPRPFVAVCTDLTTGHEVWLRDGDLIDSIRASYSLPGIFPPVQRQDRWLIDGAVTNPVPVSVCRALGARMVIGVNLNADLLGKVRRDAPTARTDGAATPTAAAAQNAPARPAGFDPLALLESQAARLPVGGTLTSLTKRLFHREPDHPSVFGVMAATFNIIMDRLTRARLAGDPPDVAIEPRVGHIGLIEFDRAEESIAAGAAAVEQAMPEIEALLRLQAGPGSPPASSGLSVTADSWQTKHRPRT